MKNKDRKTKSAKEFIEEKYDIVVDFMDEYSEVLISVGVVLVILAVVAVFCIGFYYSNKQYDKYLSSSVNTMNDTYTISDVYVVYIVDELWFCNRKLIEINEKMGINGEAYHGTGYVSDYYYRDEIYEYYDIKSKEKICQTHESGFYIESLLDLYTEKDVKAHNYETPIDDLENEIEIEDILDRDPELKIREY